jgi:hypothetical protein
MTPTATATTATHMVSVDATIVWGVLSADMSQSFLLILFTVITQRLLIRNIECCLIHPKPEPKTFLDTDLPVQRYAHNHARKVYEFLELIKTYIN